MLPVYLYTSVNGILNFKWTQMTWPCLIFCKTSEHGHFENDHNAPSKRHKRSTNVSFHIWYAVAARRPSLKLTTFQYTCCSHFPLRLNTFLIVHFIYYIVIALVRYFFVCGHFYWFHSFIRIISNCIQMANCGKEKKKIELHEKCLKLWNAFHALGRK